LVDLFLVTAIVVSVVVGVAIGFLAGRALTAKAKDLEFREREKAVRRDSITRSRSTLSGQVLERLAPHLPDFPYDPTELRFIGTPVDYLVFRGLSLGAVEEIVFLEVKSGKGHLSPGQRSVRDAVKALRVAWVEYKVPAR